MLWNYRGSTPDPYAIFSAPRVSAYSETQIASLGRYFTLKSRLVRYICPQKRRFFCYIGSYICHGWEYWSAFQLTPRPCQPNHRLRRPPDLPQLCQPRCQPNHQLRRPPDFPQICQPRCQPNHQLRRPPDFPQLCPHSRQLLPQHT